MMYLQICLGNNYSDSQEQNNKSDGKSLVEEQCSNFIVFDTSLLLQLLIQLLENVILQCVPFYSYGRVFFILL